MLNILSVEPGHKLTGKEINVWCIYQLLTGGSHYKEAIRLGEKGFSNSSIYEAIRTPANTGCGTKTILNFRKVNT